jgi:hypothetical protein
MSTFVVCLLGVQCVLVFLNVALFVAVYRTVRENDELIADINSDLDRIEAERSFHDGGGR